MRPAIRRVWKLERLGGKNYILLALAVRPAIRRVWKLFNNITGTYDATKYHLQ